MSKAVGGEGAIPDEVVKDYDLKETLGTGHFSKVKLGIKKDTGEKCAVKVRRSRRRRTPLRMRPAAPPDRHRRPAGPLGSGSPPRPVQRGLRGRCWDLCAAVSG